MTTEMNRGINFCRGTKPAFEFAILSVVMALYFLCGMIISFRLWVPAGFLGRTVPNLPIYAHLFSGVSFGLIILGALILLLEIAQCQTPTKEVHLILVACLAALIAGDQLRIQPWVWMYLLWVAISVVFTEPAGRLAAGRVLMACIYGWAGIHKLQPEFLSSTVQPILQYYHLPISLMPIGIMIPVTEIFLAFLLAFGVTRHLSIFIATCLHCFVIFHYCIVKGYNSVILPWNLACLSMVIVVSKYRRFKITGLAQQWAVGLLWVVAGVLPALHLFGAYPAYLSWSLYTGRSEPMFMKASKDYGIPEQQMPYLPGEIRDTIDVDQWVMLELRVPANSLTPASRRNLRRDATVIFEKVK